MHGAHNNTINITLIRSSKRQSTKPKQQLQPQTTKTPQSHANAKPPRSKVTQNQVQKYTHKNTKIMPQTTNRKQSIKSNTKKSNQHQEYRNLNHQGKSHKSPTSKEQEPTHQQNQIQNATHQITTTPTNQQNKATPTKPQRYKPRHHPNHNTNMSANSKSEHSTKQTQKHIASK